MRHPLSCHRLYTFIIMLLFTITGMAYAANSLPPPGALSPMDAMKLIRSQGKQLTVIDVRTPAEFDLGHLPDAMLLPIQILERYSGEIPNAPILLICRTGRRAAIAFDIIRNSYPDKKNLWYLQGTPLYHPDGTYEFR